MFAAVEVADHDVMVSLTAAIFAGGFLTVLARRLQFPTIILLLAGGILLGPEFAGIVKPESLQEVLGVIVSFAVGLILFEGGLTLDLKGFQTGSQVIPRLLSIGVLITWFGAAAAMAVVFEQDVAFALLAGSLVIVTGPTVILPILKRIRVDSRVHNILHWESVMIDAIGVFVAILCFEWVVDQAEEMAVWNFCVRVFLGTIIGVIGGYLIYKALQSRMVPEHLINGFTLASAILVFGLTESFIAEGGLLAVTLAGFVVGWFKPDALKQIQQFKSEIVDLLIGLLFILLVARLELQSFLDFGWNGILLVAIVILVVRPISVMVCTFRTGLNWREKVFLSWVAPRGIVAASMASLFAIALSKKEGFAPEQAALLEIFVYSVIVTTVVCQGFSAGFVAWALGLQQKTPTGWIIVGASRFGREIAKFLKEHADVEVMFIDTNPRLVAATRKEGFKAYEEDARYIDQDGERLEFRNVGNLLAFTDNAELNELICDHWRESLGNEHIYRWGHPRSNPSDKRGRHGLEVFLNVGRPSVMSVELEDNETHTAVLEVDSDDFSTPGHLLFILRKGAVIPALALPADASEAEKKAASPQKGDRILVLLRSTGFLSRAIDAGMVIDEKHETMEGLYDHMIALLCEKYPDISATDIKDKLTEGDVLFPALLGHGIAVPHVYSSRIDRRICILARLQTGIDAHEEEDPVQLVFFIVSPVGDPESHLTTLAEVAVLCSDEDRRVNLVSAETPDEVRKLIRKADL